MRCFVSAATCLDFIMLRFPTNFIGTACIRVHQKPTFSYINLPGGP